ncbi:hypothetical protein ACVWW5_005935 [Bradyrhizobium sp. LM3.4]
MPVLILWAVPAVLVRTGPQAVCLIREGEGLPSARHTSAGAQVAVQQLAQGVALRRRGPPAHAK